jgi:iron(III) transport system substrate-binding protein
MHPEKRRVEKMVLSRWRCLIITVCVALVLLVSGVQGGITPEEKAAALKEKEVIYYTAAATGHTTQVKAAAEKALGIKVNVVRLSSGLLYNRAVKEFETGVHAADVIETSVIDHFIDMKKKGMLQPFTPTSIALYRGPEYYDPEHYWHASRIGLGAINYNRELVKGDMIPNAWRDLTNPKYKDKLVQGHIKASGTSAIVDFFLVQLYGWEYFEALRKNNILTHQSCDQANLLASGERLIDLCDNQLTAPAQAQGMPIETVFPEDGVFAQVGPVAVLARAPHPNAGKLFIDWLTSPAGQTVHAAGGILSPLESPEVQYPPGFPDPKMLKLMIPDPQQVGEWLQGAREKFSELFGG